MKRRRNPDDLLLGGLRVVSPDEYAKWDSFVSSAAGGTIFHSTAWKQSVDRSYGGGKLLLVGARDEAGEFVAGYAALARKRVGGLWREGMTPLLAPYAGYVVRHAPADGGFNDDSTLAARVGLVAISNVIWQHYLGRERLVLAPGFPHVELLQRAGYQATERATFHIDLRRSPDELWAGLKDSAKRQIRKAEKHPDLLPFERSEASCRIEEDASRLTSDDQLHAWELFRRTFEKRGEACPVARSWFEEVVFGTALKPYRQLFEARRRTDGELGAFVMLLRFAGVVSYAVAATAEDLLPTGVSSMLVWKALENNASTSCHTFDFVGANIPSIARFKEGFGVTRVPYYAIERTGSVETFAEKLKHLTAKLAKGAIR